MEQLRGYGIIFLTVRKGSFFGIKEKMGIKEKLQQAQQQKEAEIRRRQEEAMRKKVEKIELLHGRACELMQPYMEAIKRSDCVTMLNELSFARGLKREKANRSSRGTFAEIETRISYLSGNEEHFVTYRGLNYSDGFWEFQKEKNWPWDPFATLKDAPPESLAVKDCMVLLAWDWYDGEAKAVLFKFRPDPNEGFIMEIGKKQLPEKSWNREVLEDIIVSAYFNIESSV